MGDWIGDRWPAFREGGKEDVTVKHILTHTGGFPETPPELTPEKMVDWDACVAAVAKAPLRFRPGEAIAYHSLNFGWVVGEVLRLVDGRPISQFLREEVTDPLGMKDFYLGLPPSEEHRVAKLYVREEIETPELVGIFNTPAAHQAVIPAGNGISTARDLARFYAMLSMAGTLDGVEVIRPGVIKSAAAVQEKGEDALSGQDVKAGAGLRRGRPANGHSTIFGQVQPQHRPQRFRQQHRLA